MTTEVEQLYALAAWKRFDDEVTDTLLRAVTSAFALIAVADGDLGDAEDASFLNLLRDHPKLFPQLDFDAVDKKFYDICSALLSDPIKGREHALREISAVRTNATHCELVRSAAEVAMAADTRGALAEGLLMDEISLALNSSH